FGYEVGTAFQANVGAAVPLSDSFDLVPKISYLFTTPDRLDGKDTFASGGHVLSVVPGFRWKATSSVDLEVFVEIPIFRDLRTETLEPIARFAAGVTVRF